MITEKFANHVGYSDVNPFEVVKVVSDKTVEVREMEAIEDPSVKMNFVPGGFSAICTNNRDQKWDIKPDTTASVIRIRLGKNGWKDKYGRKFVLSSTPVKYYDYNF